MTKHHCAALIIGVALLSIGAAPTCAAGRIGIDVPVFERFVLVEVDKEGNEVVSKPPPSPKGRFKRLTLQVAVDGSGEPRIPTNFENAVVELREMLPSSYRDFLLAQYGYVPNDRNVFRGRGFNYTFDDRTGICRAS